MTNLITDISQRQAAKIAGFGYLLIFILGIFAYFFAFESLIVRGDAATTANNIIDNELLFRFGIASWVFVLSIDVVVAWALYVLLKPVNGNLSLFAAWFRLVFVAIFISALFNLFTVLQILSGPDFLTVFETNQLHAQSMLFLNAYQYGVDISFVFLSIHIFILGYLIIKSDYIPRFLGVLMIVASVGSLTDSFANFLSSNYANYEVAFLLIVVVPAITSELSLTFWLLWRGFNGIEKTRK